MSALWLLGAVLCSAVLPGRAVFAAGPDGDALRLLYWRVELGARGPGDGLSRVLRRDAAALATAQTLADLAPDIAVLSGIDHDHDAVLLRALAALLAEQGHDMPHQMAFPSNAGLRLPDHAVLPEGYSGRDLAQGFGAYFGARGLAVLSTLPLLGTESRDFSDFLWRDLPGALLPAEVAKLAPVQRLSSTGHWDIAVDLGAARRVHLLIYQAGPPVFGDFDGVNFARNHDETAFWSALLAGKLPFPPPEGPFVIIGGSNLDPFDGDGAHSAMRALLDDPRLQDPEPRSSGGRDAALGAQDQTHLGPPELDTVHWPQAGGPGNLRVSYILPDARLHVHDAGVHWPIEEEPDLLTRHKPVWVDLERSALHMLADQSALD
ncbi:MAG: endonuclease/exonuclease/phosphatase family protein [Roseinatronobacter sp.]